MKKYLLAFFFVFFLSFSLVFAQNETEFNDTISCAIVLDTSFDYQLSELEQAKQDLKNSINDTYLNINSTIDKNEKKILKNQISLWKKEMFRVNYAILLLYKKQYLSKSI